MRWKRVPRHPSARPKPLTVDDAGVVAEIQTVAPEDGFAQGPSASYARRTVA